MIPTRIPPTTTVPQRWTELDPGSVGIVVERGTVGVISVVSHPVAVLMRALPVHDRHDGASAVVLQVTGDITGPALAAALVGSSATAEDADRVARIVTIELAGTAAARLTRRRRVGEDGMAATVAMTEVTYVVPVPGQPSVLTVTCSVPVAAFGADLAREFDDLASALVARSLAADPDAPVLGACA